MSQNFKNWPILTALVLATVPIVLMYSYLVLDTITNTEPGGILPSSFTLEHWRFLYEDIEGKANIWQVTLNTFVFASSVMLLVLSVSSTAGYALSRLNIPFRR